MKELRAYAHYFHNMGMNLTCIKGKKDDEKSFKRPIDEDWDNLYLDQSLDYINKQPWEDCTGIGVVLGHNKFRALDFDYLTDDYEIDDQYRGSGAFFTYSEDGEETVLLPEDYPSPLETLIKKFLCKLKLPNDYEWVVYSGSRRGFHIIFKTEDIESFFCDSWAFSPKYGRDLLMIKGNDLFASAIYGLDERPFCDHYELRWGNHLVLPPSVNKDSNTYTFRCGSLPSKEPLWVNIEDINNLIDYLSSSVKVGTFKYGELNNIPYVFYERGRSELRSLCTYNYKVEDDIKWMEQCHSPQAYNALATIYLFGKGVKSNINKSAYYFKKAANDVSYFNMASILASGSYKGTYEDFERYLSLSGDSFSKYYDRLKELADINIKFKNDDIFYMFFDTETVGLPSNFNAPSSDIRNWPRLLQLSWILTDVSGNIIREEDHFIDPDGFDIPQYLYRINGITPEITKTWGERIDSVLESFVNDLNYVKTIVGHNVVFDQRVVGAELIRLGKPDIIANINSIDTMIESADFCDIPSANGKDPKFPKLQELYNVLFQEDFTDAHNSLNDVKATMKCFWRLKELDII